MVVMRLERVFDFSAKNTHVSHHQVKYSMTSPLLVGPLNRAVTVCGNRFPSVH
jgi:hypothetical protein